MADRSSEKSVKALDIWLGETPVGQIVRAAGGQNIFLFGESYAEMQQRPTLSLSFQSPSGTLSNPARGYPGRVPPFFANLLPEGELRGLLAKRAGVNPQDEFALLGALGADLPGAVKVTPASGYDTEELTGTPAVSAEGALRFSLAGVQLKLSAVLKSDGGLTIPATGVGGAWIVKLPAMRMKAVPENEFVMMTLAEKVGIPVPPVRLVSLDDISGLPPEMHDWTGQALAIRRFDRPEQGRLHMEDFAQVFGRFPESKYENHSYANIAAVLAASAGQQSVLDFVRRLMFSALVGNGDMHLKNWSVTYEDTIRPKLSPAYDLVSTIPYIADDDLALGFGRSKSFAGFDRDRMERFAKAAKVPFDPVLTVCRETVKKTREAWKEHEPRKLIPPSMDKRISSMIEAVARDALGGGVPIKQRAGRKSRKARRQKLSSK